MLAEGNFDSDLTVSIQKKSSRFSSFTYYYVPWLRSALSEYPSYLLVYFSKILYETPKGKAVTMDEKWVCVFKQPKYGRFSQVIYGFILYISE